MGIYDEYEDEHTETGHWVGQDKFRGRCEWCGRIRCRCPNDEVEEDLSGQVDLKGARAIDY